MRRWWRRCGWPWLVLIALAQLSALLQLLANPGGLLAGSANAMQAWDRNSAFVYWLYAPYGLPVALWLWVSSFVMHRPEAEYEQFATPRTVTLPSALFRLAISQGRPVMTTCAVGIAAYGLGVCANSQHLGGQPLFHVVSGGLEALAFAIGYTFWLIALQVLLRHSFSGPAVAMLPICLAIGLGLCLAALNPGYYGDFFGLFSNCMFEFPMIGIVKCPSPVILGVIALGIASYALWSTSCRAGVAGLAAMSVCLSLNFTTWIQIVPVSISRSYWFTQAALRAGGFEQISEPTWGLYRLSYTTGGGWYMDIGWFSYSRSFETGVWRDLGILLAYLAANALWLWLQYRFLCWLLSRPRSAPTPRKC